MELQNVRLSESGDSIIILDQTQLPNNTVYKELKTAEEFYQAIHNLEVRGAPCIGIFAAYAIAVLGKGIKADNFDDFYAEFLKYKTYLNSARPTAVNLSKMLDRMDAFVKDNQRLAISVIKKNMSAEAMLIHEEDMGMCFAISSLVCNWSKTAIRFLPTVMPVRLQPPDTAPPKDLFISARKWASN